MHGRSRITPESLTASLAGEAPLVGGAELRIRVLSERTSMLRYGPPFLLALLLGSYLWYGGLFWVNVPTIYQKSSMREILLYCELFF